MEVARKVVEVTKFLNIEKRVENTTGSVVFLTNFELSKHGTKSLSTMSLALELSSVLIVDLPFSVLTQNLYAMNVRARLHGLVLKLEDRHKLDGAMLYQMLC